MKRYRFRFWFIIGLCFHLLWACSPPVDSFESADRHLREHLLPKIQVEEAIAPDTIVQNVVIPPLKDPIPDPNDFPLYGAQPGSDPDQVYLEVYSSAEKANANRVDERWMVDVAEDFNRQQQKVSSGKVIQVGIRNIPSGLAAKVLAAKVGKPAAYTPSNELWLELLKDSGVSLTMLEQNLLPDDRAGFIVEAQAYQELAAQGEVTFARLLDTILAGNLKLGYSNPFISSSSLNLLYTVLWQAAGHDKDGNPLTLNDLKSPQVVSVFDTFQNQVVLMGLTTLDLRDTFLRDSSKMQVFLSSYQLYTQLKQTAGYENIGFVPCGIAQTSPLVGFDWNTADQQAGLEKFVQFATSKTMQQLAIQKGFKAGPNSDYPPIPTGAVVKAAQGVWKQRKDGGKTVYMELVVDTSGSMEGENRLKAVQAALKLASQEINRGNQVGLITFSNNPIHRMRLAPFDESGQKRLLAAIDQLQPDGGTALYDGLAVGLAELMEKQKTDPNGKFYLLLLTDGERTDGLSHDDLKAVIQHSGVRVYPIAYGEVEQAELQEIAAVREGRVYEGNPDTVQTLLRDLFQTQL